MQLKTMFFSTKYVFMIYESFNYNFIDIEIIEPEKIQI